MYGEKKSENSNCGQCFDGKGHPIFCYTFFNAYPVKWETVNLDSQATGSSAILTDKITFKYDYYAQVAIPDFSGIAGMLR